MKKSCQSRHPGGTGLQKKCSGMVKTHMLYKISRDLTSALEKEIVESNKRLFKDYPDRMLQKHIQLITEHAETDDESM